MTLYARFGDWFSYLCLAATLLLSACQLRRRPCQP
jgi:apolipoprotein N-acyltransferase